MTAQAMRTGPILVGALQIPQIVLHITRVKRYVEERLEERLSTARLADVAQLSCGHFSRAFKTSTGVTPHAYIVGRRLARAQAVMHETDEPLSPIAAICGLGRPAHLFPLFR